MFTKPLHESTEPIVLLQFNSLMPMAVVPIGRFDVFWEIKWRCRDVVNVGLKEVVNQCMQLGVFSIKNKP